jgi:L-ascorbate metabolism protein UlaG (beta-lactamase superfamily)
MVEITWLKHSAFKIKTESGKNIYLDPYQLPDDLEKADIIITSHEHGDHFSKSDIKKIWKDDTILIGPKSIEEKLKEFNGKGLELYKSYEVQGIKIELVPAYNIKRMRPGTNETFHPQKNKWAGSIIEVDGQVIYHAGDTERIPEMNDLKNRNIDVAMLPCGGTYTMDFDESSNVAVDIKPKIVIPMHNWEEDVNKYVKILADKDPDIKVEVLENKTLTI